MTPLLEQFIAEARDFLQGIGEKLLALERAPDDPALLDELFRLVHTLKGNSGLFEFPEMTRVLHAAEDLMDAVRDGRVGYSRLLADRLLDAMDFVGALLDEIESDGAIAAGRIALAGRLGGSLRELMNGGGGAVPSPTAAGNALAAGGQDALDGDSVSGNAGTTPGAADAERAADGGPDSGRSAAPPAPILARLRAALATAPDMLRLELYRRLHEGEPLHWVSYEPEDECFYKGEDPLFQILQLPGQCWRRVSAREDWPPLVELDAYRCILRFECIVALDVEGLNEHFRYVPDQVEILPLPAWALIGPAGATQGGPEVGDFVRAARSLLAADQPEALARAARTLLEFTAADLWIASALRWLLLVLETEPTERALHLALLDAIERLEPLALGSSASPVEFLPSAGADADATGVAAPAADAGNQPPEPAPGAASGAVRPGDARSAGSGDANGRSSDAHADAGRPRLTEDALWCLNVVIEAQREILTLTDRPPWLAGRLRSVAATLANAMRGLGRETVLDALGQALEAAVRENAAAPLLDWLDAQPDLSDLIAAAAPPTVAAGAVAPGVPTAPPGGGTPGAGGQSGPGAARPPSPPAGREGEGLAASLQGSAAARVAAGTSGSVADRSQAGGAEAAGGEDDGVRFGRRADDHLPAPKTLKVDQAKIDRLMNLIGEMVVAKNALPYLAGRAETRYGVRDLAREIKTQYGVINRIAEEMQDAIMQVRMLPVSFVFQRFPRLVRDLARKLDKEVQLVMEGESTEADKNIIEALADPLIHIVRNSLDHGLETPAERQAAGKPREGRLTIRASQESDRVAIEILDDGRGIDPVAIRHKAYERGIIDEQALDRLDDQEAINLVFAPGFSTAERITDLSGRGVGMDVVRNAIAKVNGTIELGSEKGRGTRLRLTLPLSMAVSNVMIIESDGQRFGVPMDAVAETVRIPRGAIRAIKRRQTTVLRDRIVPLVALNDLLGLSAPQKPNSDDEYAALVVRIERDLLGIIVDDCRETVDIILKPMTGILAGLGGYAGSALLGDGSVLMVLDPKELVP